MQMLLVSIGVLVFGYLLGSIPFGLLIVKFKTGKDLREVESGRTGGTNTVRAAGFWAGFVTAILDILKGTISVWVAKTVSPDNHLLHVLAPVFAIIGHNYSIFLLSRDENGKLRFHGGAGGATAAGGAIGLYPGIFPVVIGAGALLWFSIGIASVATLGVALIVTIVFAVRAYLGLQSPIDVLYGILALFLLSWSLRPNIKKLLEGKERVVKYSLNGWLRARKEAKQSDDQ
jgi:glycerol-3-phosphate acyltransferase PlsY